jgi:hypothetical protein
VRLTPVACPPSFVLATLLKRAIEDELAAPPDIYVPSAPLPLPLSKLHDSHAPACSSTQARAFIPGLVSPAVTSSSGPGTMLPPAGSSASSKLHGSTSPSTPYLAEKRQRMPESDPSTDTREQPSRKPRTHPVANASALYPASASSARSGPSHRTARAKARKPALRKKAKDQKAQRAREAPRAEILKKYVESATVTTSHLRTQSLPTQSSGYEAKASGAGTKKVWTPERLEREGLRKVPWDGRCAAVAPCY